MTGPESSHKIEDLLDETEKELLSPPEPENPVAVQEAPATAPAVQEKNGGFKHLPLEAGAKVQALIPRNIPEAAKMAEAFVTAGMVPSSYEVKNMGKVDRKATLARIMIGIMKSMEVGMAPITGLSNIMVVNGRPCIWGDGAMALIQKQGKVEWIKEWLEGDVDADNWTAYCEIKRKGQIETFKRSFSVAEAKRARLWNNPKRDPWMKYPQRMLQMRARAWAIRDGFADCLSGLSIAEEAQDQPEVKKIQDTSFLNDEPEEGADNGA